MPIGYNTETTSDVQSTAADNITVISVTPPVPPAGSPGPHAMLLSVVTTDVYATFGNSTPASTKGHIIHKDGPPLFLPFARPFKWLPTSNAAAVVNITWLN